MCLIKSCLKRHIFHFKRLAILLWSNSIKCHYFLLASPSSYYFHRFQRRMPLLSMHWARNQEHIFVSVLSKHKSFIVYANLYNFSTSCQIFSNQEIENLQCLETPRHPWRRVAPIFMWHKQAIIELSRRAISTVVYCQNVTLCELVFGLSDLNKMVLWPGCEGRARCNFHKTERAIDAVRCEMEGCCCTKTVARKSSKGGAICVRVVGLDMEKLLKTPLIWSVSCFNLGGLARRLGG